MMFAHLQGELASQKTKQRETITIRVAELELVFEALDEATLTLEKVRDNWAVDCLNQMNFISRRPI